MFQGKLKIVLTCLCFALPVFYLQSQEQFGINYTVENGLAANEVYDLFQDSKGYIWMATDRGASRFDGYRFVNFNTDNGLSDNTVFSVTEDKKGRVWFLLSTGSFCYYLNDSVGQYRFNNRIQSTLKGKKYPRSFFIDEYENVTAGFLDKGLWNITAKGKLNCISDTSNEKKTYEGVYSGNVLSLGSVERRSSKPLDSVALKITINGNVSRIVTDVGNTYNNVTGLALNNGTFLIAYSTKLMAVFPSGKIRLYEFPATVSALCSDSEQNLWIGFLSGGVAKIAIADSGIVYKEKFLEQFSVTNVLNDHEGGYWFSTLEKGVFYHPSKLFKGAGIPAGHETTALTTDGKGIVYSGTSSGMVYQSTVEKSAMLFNTETLGKREKINLLYYHPAEDELWIAGTSKVNVLKGKAVTPVYGIGFPKGFFTDESGTVGLGSSNNVIILRDKKPDKVFLSCGSSSIRADAVCYDPAKKKLWAGTLDGLYFLKENCLQKDSSFPYRINCLALSKANDELIIGSNGYGVFIRSDRKMLQISDADGLSANSVNGLALDPWGAVWVATNTGLNWITISGGKIAVKKFTVSNGLLSNKVNSVVCCDSIVWIGTDAGTFYFDPRNHKVNPVPPRIYIDEFTVNGTRISAGQANINLSSSQNHVELAFTGIGFRANGNMLYRYRLSDAEWKYTYSRQLVFPSLPPGNYRFEVYAQNENGVWSESPAIVAFSISSPFYLQYWFVLSSLFVIGGTIYLLYSRRVERIRDQHEIRLKLAELKQQALFAQLNPHFVFNLLNSIQGFIISENRDTALKHIGMFAKLMRLVLHTSASQLVTLKQECDLLNLYLELNAVRYKGKFRYEIKQENNLSPRIQIPGMLVQPYVENSIKHGVLNIDHEGIIRVIFSFTEREELFCTIEDNGIGMKRSEEIRMQKNPEHKPAGMILSSDRLKLLCADMKTDFLFHVTDKSEIGENGTTIRFRLPYMPAMPLTESEKNFKASNSSF